jgi:hypothetical protein
MLAAYLKQQPDTVPVSPEFWDQTGIEVSGRPWHEVTGPFSQVPWWKTHLAAFEYFEADAWILAEAAFPNNPGCEVTEASEWIGPEEIETRYRYKTPKGELSAIARSTPTYEIWKIVHPVKNFPEDMKIYETIMFPDPTKMEVGGVEEVLAGVGEKGLVTYLVGELFSSQLSYSMEGGYAAVINALLDYPDYCRELQKRYIEFQAAVTEEVCKRTKIEAFFVNSGYSGPPITSPNLYKEWDVPALKAVGDVCKKYGKALHVHQHGRVGPVIELLIEAGVTIVCPMIAPPQGDVDDLGAFKQRYGRKIALKGNIDPFGVLMNGTPEQVEAEVKACLEAGAPGGGFILGTQDSTLAKTPFENIRAMVAAGRKYGVYDKSGNLTPA